MLGGGASILPPLAIPVRWTPLKHSFMSNVEQLIKEFKEKNTGTLKLEGLKLNEIPEEVFTLKNLKNLVLNRNNIREIPKQISQLSNLRELWLNNNKLEEIPIELALLPNLVRLHLSYNRFTKFPVEILSHESLRHICLRNNFIIELPPEIDQTKIADIQITRNKIERIPITFENADFYLSLGLEGNPLKDPPEELLKTSTALVKFLFERDKGKVFTIPFTTELKTTFKQYLTYFGDFVNYTKGRQIGFEVRDVHEGIAIEVKTENNTDEEIEEVKTYMQEYVSFIKSHVDEIKPKFEIQLDDTNKNFVILELRSQVRHMQTQVDIQLARNSALIEDRDRYYELLKNLTQQTPTYNITNRNFIKNVISQDIDFKIEIQQSIPDLLENLTNLRKLVPVEEKLLTNELEKIDDELLLVEESSNQSASKPAFKRLKRVLDEINNEESTINKALKGSKKAIQIVQNIAKTYNNFAEWLALPQVPKVLLGKD